MSWITYKRILSSDGKQWLHPDFANDGRTTEKYKYATDNITFLANTSVVNFASYSQFSIIQLTDANGLIEKAKLTRLLPEGHYTVGDFFGKFSLTQLAIFATSTDSEVKGLYVWIQNLRENDINTKDARIAGGLQLLVSKGIITQELYNSIMV